MAQFLQILKKSRFLLVGALVFAFLSSPFITEAGSKSTSSVQVVSATDTIAGLSSEIEVQGKPYQNLELTFKKPDHSLLNLKAVTDGQGTAEVTVSSYHLQLAGIYQVAAREAGTSSAYGASQSFEVYAGTVSETQSSVELTKRSAGLGETVQLTVSLKDSYKNAIDGHVLKVIPNNSSATVYSEEFATDEQGQMVFYISAEKKGVYDFTVFDSSANKTLSTKAQLAVASSSAIADIGGNERITLASDAGPVDGFVISGLNDPSVTGEAQSVIVKAVDVDGFTALDYTGTIHFSTTDNSATLPSDYTFMADDQGEHTFTLSVKLLTPGTQTLTVTDTDTTSLTGETTVEVTTSDEGVDYNSNFETTDFQRDGDFTLISPAAGSYSSDSLEVQGEAEYGYTAVAYMNADEVARAEVDFDNTFTLELTELEDGSYELYVDIVELGDGDPGEEEILNVIEESDSEEITIDTTAPEIVSISTDPEDGLTPSQTVTITVLSEADLDEASVIFEDEVYPMEETSTSGKYQADITMPAEAGDYTVDILLMDQLGNEVEYRDQLALSVAESTIEDTGTTDTNTTETTVSGVEKVSGLTATNAAETVLLSWEPVSSENEIAYYKVYYGPSESSLYAVSETYDSSTSWSILNLTGDQKYYFAVAAVDVEGTEGELSDTVLGTPTLASIATDTDAVDDTSETPAITTSADTVESTPESGPAQNALLLLSALGALAYIAARRKRAAAFRNF